MLFRDPPLLQILIKTFALFFASFCKGAVESSVMADPGLDVNLLSPSVLDKMIKAQPSLSVRELHECQVFNNELIGSEDIRCQKEVTSDILLRIRHGTNLLLPNIQRLISDAAVQHVFIRRHVLSALGLNNRTFLAAASDRHNGVVDVPEALRLDGRKDTHVAGSSSAIREITSERAFEFGSTYLSDRGEEEDFLKESKMCVDFGADEPATLQKAIGGMITEVQNNGLSNAGADRIRNMLEKYPVFDFGWKNPYQPTYHQ